MQTHHIFINSLPTTISLLSSSPMVPLKLWHWRLRALSCEEARFRLARAETLRSARLSRFRRAFAANHTIHVAFEALPSDT